MEKMFEWLQNAPNEASYKRRLAIWLTHTGRLHAGTVADTLGVSTGAVWLWIKEYNSYGPNGLKRKGRGGRRWGFMTMEQEADLLKPLVRKIRSGQLVKTAAIKEAVEQKLGRIVSNSYVYRMLNRHQWGEIIAQSRAKESNKTGKDDFQKFSRPWLRSI